MPRTCVSAAAPGLPANTRLSRRNLLAGLPAASAALMLPQGAETSEPDPVVVHYREWLAARRDWHDLIDLPGNDDWDHPRSVAASAREERAEIAMLKQPPTTPAGVAALAAVVWQYTRPDTADPAAYAREADNWECRFVRAIWTACTGKEGYPEIGIDQP